MLKIPTNCPQGYENQPIYYPEPVIQSPQFIIFQQQFAEKPQFLENLNIYAPHFSPRPIIPSHTSFSSITLPVTQSISTTSTITTTTTTPRTTSKPTVPNTVDNENSGDANYDPTVDFDIRRRQLSNRQSQSGLYSPYESRIFLYFDQLKKSRAKNVRHTTNSQIIQTINKQCYILKYLRRKSCRDQDGFVDQVPFNYPVPQPILVHPSS